MFVTLSEVSTYLCLFKSTKQKQKYLTDMFQILTGMLHLAIQNEVLLGIYHCEMKNIEGDENFDIFSQR